MITQNRNQILSSTRWAAPLAIFCLAFVLLLISGVIVLALIPIYLPTKDITTDTSHNAISFSTVYASDVTDGQSRTLSNINDISTQLLKSIPLSKNTIQIESAGFLSARASAKKKRQTSNDTITCEHATGLYGDVFVTQHRMTYSMSCQTLGCQRRDLEITQSAIQTVDRRVGISMQFTDGETHIVQLAFCEFAAPASVNDGSVSSITTTAANVTEMATATATEITTVTITATEITTVTITATEITTVTITATEITTATATVATATNTSVCTSNTSTYIYLLDQDSNFFQFHPTTFEVTFIGTLNCSTTAYPYSMALQRNGTAWTLYTDGNLYTFDIETVQCRATSYASNQEGLILFGMNFATNGLDENERLYISSGSSDPRYRLATIDVDTLEVSIIGYYYTISARAELTGTNDGRLFGLFEGAPFTIAEINRTNGQILSKASQNMIDYTPDSSHFAFTSYLSNFFLFVGNYSFTDIFFYNSTTNATTKEKTIPSGIVGAGISTCVGI